MIRREKNSPKVWDNIWKDAPTKKMSEYNFEKSKKSIEWIRIKKILIDEYGDLSQLDSIEIGAGMGMHSLLLASEGVSVTILDYSSNAIEVSKLLFKHNNLKDAFNMGSELKSKFDISMSFGTAEHFKGKKRIDFIRAHFDVLKKGGMTFIAVPNKWNPQYRLHKFLSELFGRWNFGEEYPFSRKELRDISKKIKHKFYFIGYSIFSDPFLISYRVKKALGIKVTYKKSNIKEQRGTILDKYFGTLVAFSQK